MTFWGLPGVINQLKSNQRLDHLDFTFWKLDRMIVSILCTLCDMLWLAEQFVMQLRVFQLADYFLVPPIVRFIKRDIKKNEDSDIKISCTLKKSHDYCFVKEPFEISVIAMPTRPFPSISVTLNMLDIFLPEITKRFNHYHKNFRLLKYYSPTNA